MNSSPFNIHDQFKTSQISHEIQIRINEKEWLTITSKTSVLRQPQMTTNHTQFSWMRPARHVGSTTGNGAFFALYFVQSKFAAFWLCVIHSSAVQWESILPKSHAHTHTHQAMRTCHIQNNKLCRWCSNCFVVTFLFSLATFRTLH